MNRLFNMDNGVFRVLNKIIDCFWVSILFVISCIPVFTAGAAMSALYYTIQKSLKHDRGYVSKEYWKAFRTNFKQTTLIWIVMLVIGLVLFWDIKMMISLDEAGNMLGKAYLVFEAILFLEIMWGIYIFPYIARFENNTKTILKNAGYMAILHFPKTLVLLVVTVALAIGVYLLPIPLIFIVPALSSWFQNWILEGVFRKYMTEEDRLAEDEMNREYKN